MVTSIHHGTAVAGAAKRVGAALHERVGVLRPPVQNPQIKARVEAAIRRLQQSPIAGSPLGQALERTLEELPAEGKGLEDYLDELRQKAAKEFQEHRHIVNALREAANLLRDPNKRIRLRREVIDLAKTGRLKAAEAWDRVGQILDTSMPFLQWMERRIGEPLTVGLSLQAKGGLVVAGQYAEGISGVRHGLACYFRQLSVGVGVTEEVGLGAQVSVSRGLPSSGFSWGAEVGIGGGTGGALGASASFNTTLKKRIDPDQGRLVRQIGQHLRTAVTAPIIDYEFSGLAASIGTGEGFDLGVAWGGTRSWVLGGRVG